VTEAAPGNIRYDAGLSLRVFHEQHAEKISGWGRGKRVESNYFPEKSVSIEFLRSGQESLITKAAAKACEVRTASDQNYRHVREPKYAIGGVQRAHLEQKTIQYTGVQGDQYTAVNYVSYHFNINDFPERFQVTPESCAEQVTDWVEKHWNGNR